MPITTSSIVVIGRNLPKLRPNVVPQFHRIRPIRLELARKQVSPPPSGFHQRRPGLIPRVVELGGVGIFGAKTEAGVAGQDGVVHGPLTLGAVAAPGLEHHGRLLQRLVRVPNHGQGGDPVVFFQTAAASVLGERKEFHDRVGFEQLFDHVATIDRLIARRALVDQVLPNPVRNGRGVVIALAAAVRKDLIPGVTRQALVPLWEDGGGGGCIDQALVSEQAIPAIGVDVRLDLLSLVGDFSQPHGPLAGLLTQDLRQGAAAVQRIGAPIQ